MKKLLGILLTLTLALSCLSLSASAEEAQLSGSITFLSGETDEEQVTVTRALIEAFEKENPGCTINLVLAGMDDREESIMADLYAGAPVDLITVDCESIGTYANAGILYPLDELIERIGEDDFIPGSRVQTGITMASPMRDAACRCSSARICWRKPGWRSPRRGPSCWQPPKRSPPTTCMAAACLPDKTTAPLCG